MEGGGRGSQPGLGLAAGAAPKTSSHDGAGSQDTMMRNNAPDTP